MRVKLYLIMREGPCGKELVVRAATGNVAVFRSEEAAWKMITEMARLRGKYSGARVIPAETIDLSRNTVEDGV